MKVPVRLTSTAGCLSIWLLALFSPPALAEFELKQAESAVAGVPGLTETVWRAAVPPDGQFDVIGLHRFRMPEEKAKAVMLYLPGTNMNGELAVRDEDHNLWLYLAARGVPVFTLDYRTHAIPNDYDGSFEFMRQWTVERFTNDAALALEKVRAQSGSLPVFVAGFSRGVTFAYALAGSADLDGLVVLDGSFKDFQPGSFDQDSAFAELEKRGSWASILSAGRGWENRAKLMQGAAENPDGPAMDPRNKTIGEQLTAVLYYAWGPGALANAKEGISSVQVLARLMKGYDRFYPMIQNIEGKALATYADDPKTALDDQFGSMKVPIIYFGATNLGVDHLLNGIYSAGHSGSRDVTINVLENHGHLDVLVANDARANVYEPVLNWISRLK